MKVACTDIACMLLDECSEIIPALSEFMMPWAAVSFSYLAKEFYMYSYSVQPKNVLSNTILDYARDSVAWKEKRMVNTK